MSFVRFGGFKNRSRFAQPRDVLSSSGGITSRARTVGRVGSSQWINVPKEVSLQHIVRVQTSRIAQAGVRCHGLLRLRGNLAWVQICIQVDSIASCLGSRIGSLTIDQFKQQLFLRGQRNNGEHATVFEMLKPHQASSTISDPPRLPPARIAGRKQVSERGQDVLHSRIRLRRTY